MSLLSNPRLARLSALAALACLCASSARGEANDPGSLLLFPEVDARPGSITFLTVTNVHPTSSIRVHFNYVDGTTCLKYDASELLTPRDTITAFSGAHAPGFQQGFAYAYALSLTGAPIDFDYLIGSVQVLDGSSSSEYQINALIFEGMTGPNNPTNVDGDNVRDLNGIEYSQAADQIAIPRFLGQDAVPGVRSDLVMVGLTGGTAFTTTLDFLIYNDNEQVFSASHTFHCWDRVPLLSISGAFSNQFLHDFTNDDPDEIIGMPGLEAGWFLIDGGTASSTAISIDDPAFVAVLVEVSRLSAADLPFTIGTQNNGDLLPSSIFGDT